MFQYDPSIFNCSYREEVIKVGIFAIIKNREKPYGKEDILE